MIFSLTVNSPLDARESWRKVKLEVGVGHYGKRHHESNWLERLQGWYHAKDQEDPMSDRTQQKGFP